VQGDPGAIVRLGFAKGSHLLQFIWGPRRLLGWRAMSLPGAAAVVPQSATECVHYHYRLPHLVRVTFDGERGIRIVRGDTAVAGRKASR
jgi:hypothetical protein